MKNRRSSRGTLAFLAIAAVAAGLCGLVLFLIDRSTFEKVATRIVMPCGLIWIMLLMASVLLLRSGQRTAGLVLLVIWLGFSVVGNQMTSEQLLLTLESPYAAVDPLSEEPFDTIIVLGGGTSVGANGRVQGSHSGDRLILSAQMFHAGLTERIICTGGKIASINVTGLDPAEESQITLIGLGVPEDRIERLPGRNTSEEMTTLGKRFDQSDHVGLVTSAWHLPRALALAERNGFSPKPLPSDFRTAPSTSPRPWGYYVLAVVPDQESLLNSSAALKEHLGRALGR